MANVAAHLVDRVLPAVPVRQWVLSLPFELRALAAFRADMLSAVGRVFVEAVFARYRSWAKQKGLGDAPTGAVTHVQRFGSSVNLNVHFHSMLLDGVFTRDEQGSLRFHPAPPPTREELDPGAENDGGNVEAPLREGEGAVELDGFNLHASVTIPGHDDLGRND